MARNSEPTADDPATAPKTRRREFGRVLRRGARIALISGVLLVAALAITGLLSKDRIEIPPNYLGQYIDVHGERIRYYQTGSGPDLLLIHGMPGLIEDWSPLFAAANKFRITAYDRPGHGFSSQPGEYSLAHNADIALGLMDQLKLKDVIVVGHSYGGAVALALAARNPPEARGFIALGGVTTNRNTGLTLFDLNRLPIIGRGLAALGCILIGEGMVRSGEEMVFSPNEALLTEEYVKLRAPVFLQTKVPMAISREAVAFPADMRAIEPQLSTIAKPVHFIHGDKDRIVPAEDTVHFHERFPRTVLTVLKGTGHAVMESQSGAVLSAIESMGK